MTNTKSQNARIAANLSNGKKLTGLQALRLFGCFRLASRVWDLREQGLDIKSKFITRNGKTFSQYYI